MKLNENTKQVCLFAMTVAVGTLCYNLLFPRHRYQQPRSPVSMAVKPESVTLQGSSQVYVLVEFTDYQRPVCRVVEKTLPALVSSYKGRVSLVVRNFPLSYHKFAYGAAIAAEAARAQGKFNSMHDALMSTSDISAQNIRKIAMKNHVDMKRFDEDSHSKAVARLAIDQSEFTTLHLPGTPAFLLCSPAGKVVPLGQLSQLRELIK